MALKTKVTFQMRLSIQNNDNLLVSFSVAIQSHLVVYAFFYEPAAVKSS
jgi:hypothetical protein